MFYVIAALMLLLALLFILLPLLLAKRSSQTRLSTEAANLEAFRQQKREITAEFQRGLMTEAERDGAMDELATRAATEIDVDSKVKQGRADSSNISLKTPWILGFVISLFVVAGSVLGYATWGQHDARVLTAATATTKNADAPLDPNAPMSDKQIVALVDNLAKKMQENPNDAKGWILLARTQQALGQLGASVDAFQRAVALTPNDAQLLADYADAQAMVQEGVFEGKPRALIAQALKADPKNMKALALAGTAEMRAGNKPASLKYWEKLKSLVPPDSDDYKQVSAIIVEIKTGKPAFPESTQATQQAKVDVQKDAPVAAGAGKSVMGTVNIASALKSKIAAGDTLFIFARSAAKGAPKMPLAVLRIPVPATWPHTFALSDAMAMAPGMNLSAHQDITIEARISKAGNALPQPGDMQGSSVIVKNDARGVSINIDKVLP
jgi:cytochrome c-type biogenesis protein CcmH